MRIFSWNWIDGKLGANKHDTDSDFLSADRYREVPSFGRDTIRRFTANSSEMKKMAAHDFENLLQVCLIAILVPFPSLLCLESAQFQFLMDSFPNPITKQS
jgi:hypothetical protein